MKKIILFTALLLASLPLSAAQTSVWRSTLTRGTSGTFVQNVDAATPEAALQACHLLVPNSATTLTEYTCNAAKRVYRVTPTVTCPAAPAPRPGTCPTGTTGTWTQTATVGPPPTCTVTWSTAPAGACTNTGSALLNWTPPTQNNNGTTLTNLAGYRIIYGRSSSNLDQVITLANPGAAAYTVSGLTSGTWYFAVKSYASSGAESDASNTGSKTIP